MNINPVSFGSLRIVRNPNSKTNQDKSLIEELMERRFDKPYRMRNVENKWNPPVLKYKDMYEFATKLDIKYRGSDINGRNAKVFLTSCINDSTGDKDVFVTSSRKVEKNIKDCLTSSKDFFVEDYWENRQV